MNCLTHPRKAADNWPILVACCLEDATDFTRLCSREGSRIHWQSLCTMALQEGIAPLLFWRLRQSGLLARVPKALAESLCRKYYLTGATAAFCTSQLHDLLPRCQEAGLPIIILKGAVLAELYYPNPALRAMSDIDILVKAEDLATLDIIFSQAGYRTDISHAKTQKNEQKTYLTTRTYRRQDREGLPFHVHTHLLNSTIPNDYFLDNFPIAQIWHAARRVRIANSEALVLSSHHQILHLAEHSLRVTHSLTKLQYLYDINRVIHNQTSEIDWQTLCEEAQEWRMESFLYYPLTLACQWLKAPVPPSVLTRLQPVPGVMERLFAALLTKNIRRPGLSYLLHLSRQPSFMAQMTFLTRTVFPPRQVLARRSGIPLDEVGALVYLRRVAEIFVTLLTTIKGGSSQLREECYDRPHPS